MAKKEPQTESTVIEDMQPIAETVTAAIVENPSVAPGYVLLRLKSGKGGQITVKETMLKYYPDTIWDIVAKAQKKTPTTVKK